MRFGLNKGIRHPVNTWKTLVEYNIVLIMMPYAIIGSAIGVILNPLIPPIVIWVIMVISLAFLVVNGGIKMVQIYRKESKQESQIKDE